MAEPRIGLVFHGQEADPFFRDPCPQQGSGRGPLQRVVFNKAVQALGHIDGRHAVPEESLQDHQLPRIEELVNAHVQQAREVG